MTDTYRIAVVPGDGIGPEIGPAALDVLHAAVEPTGSRLETTEFPYGAGHYRDHGAFMPPDGLDILRGFDAILFGAVGLPEVDDTLPARDYTFKVRADLWEEEPPTVGGTWCAAAPKGTYGATQTPRKKGCIGFRLAIASGHGRDESGPSRRNVACL